MPLKILEYMSMEKIIVVTALELFQQLSRKYGGIVLIPDNECTSITTGIEYAMTHKTTLKAAARQTRHRVVQVFDWDNIAFNFARFLDSTRIAS